MPQTPFRRLAAVTLACLLATGGAAALAPSASASSFALSETTTQDSARAAQTSYSTLVGGEELLGGESIISANGSYSFVMQTDGNAVTYDAAGRPVWSTGTQGGGNRLAMQTDGNVVIYSASGRPVWTTGTSGGPGSTLTIQEDGNLVLYRADGSPAWASASQAQPVVIGDTLSGGGELRSTQQLTSTDGGSRAVMQSDGNFVVYSGSSARWSAGTSGAGNRLVMQGDGNAVVYSASGRPLWQSGTGGRGGSRLVIQNDGNLVVYSASGSALWSSTAPAAPPAPQISDTLNSGDQLTSGRSLRSTDGRSEAAMQSDGNFVVYSGGSVRWSAGTSGAGNKVVMQTDGNAVVYSGNGRALWQSATSGNPGARMVMQNDGNLVIYSTSGRALWSSFRPAPAPAPGPGPAPARPADVDCPDFDSQAEAQNFFTYWGQWYGDFARLDGVPENGQACDSYNY